MIWIIVEFLAYLFIFLYSLCGLIASIQNKKYQKMWNEKKALRIRIDPNITRAELCEYYVMFCKKNGCRVEF